MWAKGANFKLTGILLICLVMMTAASEAAVGVKIDYLNRYIWRGFDLNPDNNFVVQPSLDFTFPESRWSINLWHSMSAEEHQLNEIDLTFNYDFETSENISVSAGLIHYGWYWVNDFNQNDHTTIETYVAIGWDKLALSPKLSFNHDCKNGNGLYTQLSLSKEIALSKTQNLEISSALGYNRKQWINKSGFTDLSMTASLPLTSGKATITPFMGISWTLMKEINPDVSREYWLGLSLEF
ncbi:MAG: hypothetical protein PHV05_11270 [Candidatus Riflebacteria bacterium]|nr:hypothetical protein [Candidatus Riflebacteria bacterium]